MAKASQAHHANLHWGHKITYKVGDHVMLSTFHRWQEYRKKGDKWGANFFPRWDGPYTILKAWPQTSIYTLDMTGHHSVYPTYHMSELKRHISNDTNLFPNCDHPCPGPILTKNGLEEHKIKLIIDWRKCGQGYQFLVFWVSFGPGDDKWLSHKQVKDCQVLDTWYTQGGDGPEHPHPHLRTISN